MQTIIIFFPLIIVVIYIFYFQKNNRKKIREYEIKLAALRQKNLPPEISQGQKLIIRSNEDEPFEVGYFVRYEQLTKAENNVLIVEVRDEERICLSLVFVYSKELEDGLNKLSNKEQYAILSAQRVF